jgi:hypothetical protein
MALDNEQLPTRELFAVNVDPAEGELSMLGQEELSVLMDRIPFFYETEVVQAIEGDSGPQQGEIWKSLMFALLAFLVIESLLAWRFGAYG